MAWFDDFKKFIQRGNAVELAVALIVGAAFTAIVNSLVADIFTPVLGIATQGGDAFSSLDITLYHDAKVKVGSFLKAIINFFVIAFCVFWLVKGINALHMPRPAEPSAQEKLLTEIRDLLKSKTEPPAPAPITPSPATVTPPSTGNP
jgi:large conductance mechanosensitive channel